MYALVIVAALSVLPPAYSWRPFNDGTGDYSLWQGETQVGQWHAQRGLFYPFNAYSRTWGPACPPPIPSPVPNYGLLPSDAPGRERWTRNGLEISREEALGIIDPAPTPNIPDDAQANRLVVIGTPDQCGAVGEAWLHDAALSPWRDKVVYQHFAPDDWQVKDYGFQTAGKPVIYYLAADGTVLHRQDDFEGGPAALAEALREADAAYRPLLDPDRRSPWNAMLARVKQIPAPAWVCVALVCGVAAYLLLRKGS